MLKPIRLILILIISLLIISTAYAWTENQRHTYSARTALGTNTDGDIAVISGESMCQVGGLWDNCIVMTGNDFITYEGYDAGTTAVHNPPFVIVPWDMNANGRSSINGRSGTSAWRMMSDWVDGLVVETSADLSGASTSVNTPTDDSHAVNKAYSDAHSADAVAAIVGIVIGDGAGNYVSGDTNAGAPTGIWDFSTGTGVTTGIVQAKGVIDAEAGISTYILKDNTGDTGGANEVPIADGAGVWAWGAQSGSGGGIWTQKANGVTWLEDSGGVSIFVMDSTGFSWWANSNGVTIMYVDQSGATATYLGIQSNNPNVAGPLALFEGSTNGTDFIGIRSPASLAAGYNLTLPPDDGNNTEVLQTDGSGTLTWVANAGGGGSGSSGLTTIQTDDGNEAEAAELGDAPGGVFIKGLNGLSTTASGNSVFVTVDGGVSKTVTVPSGVSLVVLGPAVVNSETLISGASFFIKGDGATSATTPFAIEDSLGNNSFTVTGTGDVKLMGGSTSAINLAQNGQISAQYILYLNSGTNSNIILSPSGVGGTGYVMVEGEAATSAQTAFAVGDGTGKVVFQVKGDGVDFGSPSGATLSGVSAEVITANIFNPDDVVSGVSDNIAIYQVDADKFPHGIILDSIRIQQFGASGYVVNVEEWDTNDSPSVASTIEEMTIAAGTFVEEIRGTDIDDRDIAAGGWIFLDLPTTETDQLFIKIKGRIK